MQSLRPFLIGGPHARLSLGSRGIIGSQGKTFPGIPLRLAPFDLRHIRFLGYDGFAGWGLLEHDIVERPLDLFDRTFESYFRHPCFPLRSFSRWFTAV